MEEVNLTMESPLKVAFDAAVDAYVTALLERFEWDATYGSWVADDRSGVYMYDDYYISLSDVIYIVDNDVTLDDFIQWQDYEDFVRDFGLQHINLRAWVSGCPRLSQAQRDELRARRNELDELIRKYDVGSF